MIDLKGKPFYLSDEDISWVEEDHWVYEPGRKDRPAVLPGRFYQG